MSSWLGRGRRILPATSRRSAFSSSGTNGPHEPSSSRPWSSGAARTLSVASRTLANCWRLGSRLCPAGERGRALVHVADQLGRSPPHRRRELWRLSGSDETRGACRKRRGRVPATRCEQSSPPEGLARNPRVVCGSTAAPRARALDWTRFTCRPHSYAREGDRRGRSPRVKFTMIAPAIAPPTPHDADSGAGVHDGCAPARAAALGVSQAH